jgi:hypothetical protein
MGRKTGGRDLSNTTIPQDMGHLMYRAREQRMLICSCISILFTSVRIMGDVTELVDQSTVTGYHKM